MPTDPSIYDDAADALNLLWATYFPVHADADQPTLERDEEGELIRPNRRYSLSELVGWASGRYGSSSRSLPREMRAELRQRLADAITGMELMAEFTAPGPAGE